jgi:hypothetical protein
MKSKSLLVTGLLILLSLILFSLVGCVPEREIYHSRRPRTYVEFDYYWFNGRPFYQPRVIITQPRQYRQPITRQRSKH